MPDETGGDFGRGKSPQESPDARQIRLKTVAARLAGIDGVLLVAGDTQAAAHLGRVRTLSRLVATAPLEVPLLLDLALQLARTLAEVHRRGVLHLDITPDHVLLRGSRQPAVLAGFMHATPFAPEQPAFTHHQEIQRDLAYLAPEQTGRTGRRVDARADLYSLGATIFEAATGHPPFASADSLQLLHDQLVRTPPAAASLRPELPAAFSAVVARLLEKDPQRRYQSADGLAHDLAKVRDAAAAGQPMPGALGEQDFPLHLSAPAHLTGREAETEALRQALEESVHGGRRVLFISGPSGVGKSALANELRALVTARRGWFVGGKFDQYRPDAPTAPTQAFRALGRLLLAEPKSELAKQRQRMLQLLGPNAALLSRAPEFAVLFGPLPEPPAVDAQQAQARHVATAVQLLRAVVSPARPLVMVLDNLQWAGPLSIQFLEAVMDAEGLDGLLLVGAFRDGELAPAHPLAQVLERRGRESVPPLLLQLENLRPEQLRELLQSMMRLPPDKAQRLAAAVQAHTGGNPFDTVELLNALRSEGALAPGPAGWDWNEGALRRHVGSSSVPALLAARIARLPSASQSLLQAVACMGGEVRHSLLAIAMGVSPAQLDAQLLAPLEDGLLLMPPGEDSLLRMKHDRVQHAIYDMLEPAQRHAAHLALARRLSAVPESFAASLQQYLSAIAGIEDPAECRQVAAWLHEAALRTRAGGTHETVQRLLVAARSLLARVPPQDDEAERLGIDVQLHVVLCGLGRFDEADTLYEAIVLRGAPLAAWLDAACAQVSSLHNRSRPLEAVQLGLALLRELGLEVPDDFDSADVEGRLADVAAWAARLELGRDPRVFSGDDRVTAQARLMAGISYPAYFSHFRVMAWLVVEARALWDDHGPSPELVSVLSFVGSVAIRLGQDYRTAYDGMRHVLAVATDRQWEPSASEARFHCAIHVSHWFEPLEQSVRQLQLARDSLTAQGVLQTACFCARATTTALLDSAPTMAEWAREIDAGLALALRTRNEYVISMLSIEKQLWRDLLGMPGKASIAPPGDQEAPAVHLSFHFALAMGAALRGHEDVLAVHAAAAMQHVGTSAAGSYRVAQSRLLRGLSLARQARHAPEPDRRRLLEELDAILRWMALRAQDAPVNFLHLLKWLQAERAFAVDDFRAAAGAFDDAVEEAGARHRAWHHAMLTERAGLFHLEYGMRSTGRILLAQAAQRYAAWGAAAKARELELAHGLPQTTAHGAAGSSGAMSEVDTIDAAAIMRASQALSSETSLPRLTARVAEVMGALCGAGLVRLALWDDDLRDWLVFADQAGEALRMATADAIANGLLPQSAFHYAERTRETLVIDDAVTDDRFGRDPYFARLDQCSVAIVPIRSKGTLRALLVLENRASRSAFSEHRLDAISLIAGQLAVSLENALLYDRLEQRVRQQTRELLATARRAGMAQVATNVLHNVGNVLNSVNVSVHVLASLARESRSARVADLAGLIAEASRDPAAFFAPEGKGQRLHAYLHELAAALGQEREALLVEVQHLAASVDHIRNVVDVQQSYASAGGVLEPFSMTELVEDALRIQGESIASQGVTVLRDYGPVPTAPLDKTRVMQILVNLIENARQAMLGVRDDPQLTIAVHQGKAALTVKVMDNGCGIAEQHLPRIFSHGFTTKPDGHGFGLHSCAVAAKEMGGSLSVHSPGTGAGATFTLTLPLAQGGAAPDLR